MHGDIAPPGSIVPYHGFVLAYIPPGPEECFYAAIAPYGGSYARTFLSAWKNISRAARSEPGLSYSHSCGCEPSPTTERRKNVFPGVSFLCFLIGVPSKMMSLSSSTRPNSSAAFV